MAQSGKTKPSEFRPASNLAKFQFFGPVFQFFQFCSQYLTKFSPISWSQFCDECQERQLDTVNKDGIERWGCLDR